MLTLATNEVRLLLDENISPNIVPRLWDEGIDAVPLRDRAMLRARDHQVFSFAAKEDRAVATINESDFEKIVAGMESHPGVISIPSGGSRDEQFDYIMTAVEQLRSMGNAMASVKDHVLAVSDDFKISRRMVRSAPKSGILKLSVVPNRQA
jgi:predicted nuclease of predicted toxin-antitoxin system